ncbi:family 16 glycoside hydrolase, partial [Methanocrinis sp.]|uniref:family 16 glycoside hydrolase n=1 Tax=Methanocrinis sp. TaxID=3101522 RepID=UPI003D106EAE
SITVNVYYAHNGERAYSAVDDAYRFKNYNFNQSKTEELAEELIATVAAGVPSSIDKDLWLRLFFPTTYARLWDYFNESYRSGAGGHCYGMAATSALYFTDPSLRPVAKKAYHMSFEEASQNIDIYQRAQMIPVMRSLLSDAGQYFDRGYGSSSSESQSRTYAAVKRSLKEDRLPLLISFRGQKNNSTWGHAVLAYKLVEVEGEDYKQVYIYDSNTLMKDLENLKKPMPVALLWLDGFLYYSVQSGSQSYGSRTPSKIAANPVFRTIPLEEANSLLPGLKEMARGFIEGLKNEGKFAVDLKCPADALFTDSSGRRVGTVDGRVTNEIPGAEVMESGEVEIYLLPMDLEYSLEISGTGTDLVDLDVISPEGESSAKVVSFTNVSICAGEKLTSEVADGGEIEDLRSGTSTMEPSLSGVLDLGAEGEGDETVLGGEAEDGAKDESGDVAEVDPAAEQELIFERNSIWAVDNGPTSPTSFVIDRGWTITEIRTYHWNRGQGKNPGMIGLQDERGLVLGIWPASGQPGSGGVPDAYWSIRPNLTLPPGEYTILDSDPATWSQNAETAGEGIAWVYGLPSKDSGDGSGIESEGLPFTDDFDDGDMAGWTVGGLLGSWTVSAEEGVLRQNSNDFGGSEGAEGSYLGTYVTAGGPAWRNYDFMARVKPVDNDGIGLIFRYEDSSNYYRFLWVGDESSTGPLRRLDRIKGGVQTVLKSDGGEAVRYDPGRWYNLEVSLDGDVIRVYIDGVLWGEVRDGEIESGGVGLFSYAQVGVEFDDVVVTEADGSSASAAGPVSKEAVGAGGSAGSGWGLPEYGEILIDAPPGGWDGMVPGEAI